MGCCVCNGTWLGFAHRDISSSSDFAGSSNRVYAIDTRIKLRRNWYAVGQAIGSNTQQLDGQRFAGPGYVASLLL